MVDREDKADLRGLMVRHINQRIQHELSMILDVEMVSEHNWKMLAEALDYLPLEIKAIERRNGSSTMNLLHEFSLKSNSSVEKLMEHLKEIERPDAVILLQESIPAIRKTYLKEKKNVASLRLPVNNGLELRCLNPVPNTNYCPPGHHHCSRSLNSGSLGCHNCSAVSGGGRVSSLPAGPLTCSQSPSEFAFNQSSHCAENEMSRSPRHRHHTGPSYPQHYQHGIPTHINYSHHPSVQAAKQNCHNIPGLLPVWNMDVAAEEEVFTSSEASKISNYSQPIQCENPTDVICKRPSQCRPASSCKLGQHHGHFPSQNGQLTNVRCTDNGANHLHNISGEPSVTRNGFSKHLPNKSTVRMKESSDHVQNLPGNKVDGNPKELRSGEMLTTCPNQITGQVAVPTVDRKKKSTRPKLSDTFNEDIHVLVAYAADSKNHGWFVQDLCNCLKKNGFSCRSMRVETELMTEDHRLSFHQADFVLICISATYYMLSEGRPTENGNTGHSIPGKNHYCSKYLYDFIQMELREKPDTKRFISLIIRGESEAHIPISLKNFLRYKWPEEYKDLLWKLSKPDQRLCSAAPK